MKNIIICSDGAWQSPESDISIHVQRLTEGIAAEDAAGNKQVVFYDWGVGSEGDKFSGGIPARASTRIFRIATALWCTTTNRVMAVSVRVQPRSLYCALAGGADLRLRDFSARACRKSEPRLPSTATAAGREKAEAFRRSYAVADIGRTHLIGVSDTVGALGIPAPFLSTLDTKRYLFHDTEPSSIINHARHAVAIDENQQDFEPTLWSPKAGIDLQQVWFAGVHTDIGGGYPDHALGDIPGEWMAREAQACGLGLEPHFLLRLNPDYAGRQHNEYKGLL